MIRAKIPFRAKYLAKQLSRYTIGSVADYLLLPVQKFAILTNGRTGSNLLVSYLQAHPKITVYGEIIGSYYMGQKFARTKVTEQGAEYLRTFLGRTLLESHVGVKILYRQIEKPYVAEAREALLNDRSIKIIHLRRENLLDIVISRALAKTTRSFIGSDYGDVSIELSAEECRQAFADIEAWEEKYRAAFAKHDYHELSYEQLTRDTDRVLAEVYCFLGAAPTAPQSSLLRQRRASKDRVVKNYAQLKAIFENTPYRRFFA